MKKIVYSLFLLIGLWACNGQATREKGTTATTDKGNTATAVVADETPKADVSSDVADAAKKRSTTSASTLQNLATGYWHIGGAINTGRAKSQEGYRGQWIKFNQDQTYVLGKEEQNVSSGAWIFQEEGELIRFESKDSSYLTAEYHAKQLGDIVLLLGNTPTNNSGAQIKLVRESTKTIEHNPN